MTTRPVSLSPPGVQGLNESARRLERWVIAAVLVLPALSVLAGIVLICTQGFSLVDLGILLTMHFLGMVGISIGLHRHFSHGSFQTSRPLRMILLILGSMAAQGPVFYWAANHRRHHSYTDEEGDPHSPYFTREGGVLGFLRGMWHAHIGWVFDHNIADIGRFIPDLLRDPLLFAVNRLYFLWVLLGLLLPAAAGGLLTGTWMGALSGFVWGGLVRIFLGQQTVAFINSVCHVFGSKPFRAAGESRNNVLVAVLSLGEGWHNNHHAFPYSAMFGLRWWQFDPLGWLIRCLALAGVVWNVKKPSPHIIEAARRG